MSSGTTRKGFFGRFFPKKAADDSDILPRPRVTTGSGRPHDRTLRHSRSMSGLDHTTYRPKPEWNHNYPIRDQRIQVLNRGRDRNPSIQYGEADFVRPRGSAPPPPPPPKEGKHLRREQEYLASLQPREVLRSRHNTLSPARAPAPRRTVEHARPRRSAAPAVHQPPSVPRLLDYNTWRDTYEPQPPAARSKNMFARWFAKSPPVLRDERGPYLPEGRRQPQPEMFIEHFLQHPSPPPSPGRRRSVSESSLNSETWDDPKKHASYVPEPPKPNGNYVSYQKQLEYKLAKEDADRRREEIRLAKLAKQQEEQRQREKEERRRKRKEEEDRLRREEVYRRGQQKIPGGNVSVASGMTMAQTAYAPVMLPPAMPAYNGSPSRQRVRPDSNIQGAYNIPPYHHRGSSEISAAATFGSNQASLGHSNYNSSVDSTDRSVNPNAPASRPLEWRDRYYEKRNAYYANGGRPSHSPARPADPSSSRDRRAEPSSSRDYRPEPSSSRDYRAERSSSRDPRAESSSSRDYRAEPSSSRGRRADTDSSESFYAEPIASGEDGMYTFRTTSMEEGPYREKKRSGSRHPRHN